MDPRLRRRRGLSPTEMTSAATAAVTGDNFGGHSSILLSPVRNGSGARPAQHAIGGLSAAFEDWPYRASTGRVRGQAHRDHDDPRGKISGLAALPSPPRRRPSIDRAGNSTEREAAARLRSPHPIDAKPAKPNIITTIRGSRPQVADIKSEPRPASNRNRWPASYWNAWPASSESALLVVSQAQTGAGLANGAA